MDRNYKKIRLFSDFIAVKENLHRTTSFGIELPDVSHTTLGTVVAAGPLIEGIKEGDTVLYAEWQGGRWAFIDDEADGKEIRFLIMREKDLLAVIYPDGQEN